MPGKVKVEKPKCLCSAANNTGNTFINSSLIVTGANARVFRLYGLRLLLGRRSYNASLFDSQ